MTTFLQATNPEVGTFRLMDISLRTFVFDDELWFVGMDVCNALGITSRTAYRKLNADQRRLAPRMCLGLSPGKPLVLVNESGFYKLIFRSEKPAAIRFQNWVTGTVLPAIRKDGAYLMGEEKVVSGEMNETELVQRALEILKLKTQGARSVCLGHEVDVVALFNAET